MATLSVSPPGPAMQRKTVTLYRPTAAQLLASLEDTPQVMSTTELRAFTWSAVFERIERIWRALIG